MYLPYLMLGYSIAVALMVVACRITARTLPGLPGVQLLSGALSCGLAGGLLMASQHFAPAWLSVLVGYQALFGFSVLYYAALAQCLGTPTHVYRWSWGLLLAGLGADAYFTYADPSLTGRLITGGVIKGTFAGASIFLLFRSLRSLPNDLLRRSTRRYAVGALGWLQVVVVIQNLVFCVLTIRYSPAGDTLHPDHIQAAYTYLNLIFSLGAGVGLIGLAFWTHRDDLYSRANTDVLTGLLNRRAFDETLVRELRRVESGGPPLIMMMADIDFFKRVNDTLGHLAGDEVLRRVATALYKTLRPADVVCRYGGEEFALMLRDTRIRQAAETAERLRLAIAALSQMPADVRMTISIGMAESIPGEPREEFIARCDLALYRSKRAGRNRVSIATHDVADSAARQSLVGEDEPRIS